MVAMGGLVQFGGATLLQLGQVFLQVQNTEEGLQRERLEWATQG